jgi:hypothetical protein
MISILAALLSVAVFVALLILTPVWVTALVLIIGGALLLTLGLCRAASKPYPLDEGDDDNVYEFKRGAP